MHPYPSFGSPQSDHPDRTSQPAEFEEMPSCVLATDESDCWVPEASMPASPDASLNPSGTAPNQSTGTYPPDVKPVRNTEDVLSAAIEYFGRGWCVIPLGPRSKACGIREWQNLRLSVVELQRYFLSQTLNIAIHMGEASNGIIDVDLDAPIAVKIADKFLPATESIFGRASKTRSHWLYQVNEIVASAKFVDPGDGGTLVEIRSSRHLTMVPPSIHPNGERVTWHKDGKPACVEHSNLAVAVARLAAATCFAKQWKKGSRHFTSLAIAGALLAAGWPIEHVKHFIDAVAFAANDEERNQRADNVETTSTRIARGETVWGWPKLKELIGDKVVIELRKWLQMDDQDGLAPFSVRPAPTKPTLNQAALYGLPGKVVAAIEPHSEADPAGLLLHFLVALGNLIGRKAHYMVESTGHYTNLFAVMVGPTSSGRKGTSWNQIRYLLEPLSGGWKDRIQQGIRSGEALVSAVRDQVREPVDEPDDGVGGQQRYKVVDPGVADKRLMLIESEFAAVLKVSCEQSNILSPVLRSAWESDALQTLAKTKPAKATGAHVSMVGHITEEELTRYLARVDVFNGFANRFLWCMVSRSKELPLGGRIDKAAMELLRMRIAQVIHFASQVGELEFDEEATGLWVSNYSRLTADHPGPFGAVMSRASPQVIRLALLYAVSDQSQSIRAAHLNAALALWDYCEASARALFSPGTYSPDTDRILRMLKRNPGGVPRTAIRDLFQKNRSAEQIDKAVQPLIDAGKVKVERKPSAGGRPMELWILAQP